MTENIEYNEEAESGVELPPEELLEQQIEGRETQVNPSDLQDAGDPEAGDVGVAGGIAAGGEIGDGELEPTVESVDPWGIGG